MEIVLNEEKRVLSVIPDAESYSLINNYGWTWDRNDKHYDLRHWLNCYGADVDYWSVTGCDNYSMTLDEALDYIKANCL